MSETFETLHNLVHKGVKVVMDIPYELWNETSAEVADLKKQVGAPPPPGLSEGRSSVDEGHREPGDCGQAVSPRLWLRPPWGSHSHQPGGWRDEAQARPAPPGEARPGRCRREALRLTVRRLGGGVRGGDRGLVQEPPGGGPDSVPLRQPRAEGQGRQ